MECEYSHVVLLLSISQYEKTPVKVQQGLVLTNSHVYPELEDSEDSPMWAFIHSCCCDVVSETSRDDNIYIYTHIVLYIYIYINIIPRIGYDTITQSS